MKLKPFRLLSRSALMVLKSRITQQLQQWQDEYAQMPLRCQLERTSIDSSITQLCWLLSTEDQPIALMPHPNLSEFNKCLFGQHEAGFERINQILFVQCIAQLLDTKPLRSQPLDQSFDIDSCFYPGAPLVTLTLQDTPLYLHPKWTIDALPRSTLNTLPLTRPSIALDQQPVALQVELSPLSLPLHDLIHLKIGDVIKTDHPLDDPMKLKHQHHAICNVQLGEYLRQKTIQLTRTL